MSMGMMTSGAKKFDTSKMVGQRVFMQSKAEWLLYSGAFGAGKSKVGCEKINFLSIRYPGNFCAILRKTFASLRHTTMRTMFRDVVVEDHIEGYNKESHILKYKNGSEVLFIGLDTDTKIGSLELGGAFVDEVIEIDEDTWIMLDGRVGRLPHIPFSQLMAATNPASTTHWMYKYFFVPPFDSARQVIQANSLENPYLTDDYRSKLEKYTGRHRQRYVLGQWVGYEGLVYDNVEIQEVVIPRFRIPGHWRCYRAIDFGYTNPFVCQWWGQCPPEEEYEHPEGLGDALADICPCDPDDVVQPYSLYHYSRCLGNSVKGIYRYREIYMSKRLVETHGHLINQLTGDETIRETFADWDAEGRATLESIGVLTSPARKRIEDGIQVCHILFDQGRIHFMEKSLVEEDQEMVDIGNHPICSEQEFGSYRWLQMPDNKNNKEIPVDKDNHGMDAMRYIADTLLGDELMIKDTIFQTRVLTAPQRRRDPTIVEQRDWAPTRNRNWRNIGF